jgi:hypothetical protein
VAGVDFHAYAPSVLGFVVRAMHYKKEIVKHIIRIIANKNEKRFITILEQP